MKSVTEYAFSMVPSANIQRSVFDRSHGYKTAFNSGLLIPFYVDEALPGDTFHCRSTLFARLSTPIVPIMDNMYLETFYFAVPYRLVWSDWEHFNGGRDNVADIMSPPIYEPPYIESGSGWALETLHDYFGLPTSIQNIWAECFWHRAYYLIYNEWFRDENLQDKLVFPLTGGLDTTDYQIQTRNKRHDYFTSCLPWPQKGPGVDVPMSGHAPVVGNGRSIGLTNDTNIPPSNSYGLSSLSASMQANPSAFGNMIGSTISPGGSTDNTVLGLQTYDQLTYYDPSGVQNSGMYADLDLTTSGALTINILRAAFQIQKMHERDARGGTRYTEIIRSHFGVISPDARLQRPEYLGGSSSRMIINPVQ